jgi:V8-like Glu-specific endopeptidase
MSVPLANYTLTYNESVQGWPSFYSFAPEFIKGMNQYLYTFKGGNLYRHNVNESRNTFYGVQPAATSTITTVLNTDALTTKLYSRPSTLRRRIRGRRQYTVIFRVQGTLR